MSGFRNADLEDARALRRARDGRRNIFDVIRLDRSSERRRSLFGRRDSGARSAFFCRAGAVGATGTGSGDWVLIVQALGDDVQMYRRGSRYAYA